MCGNKCAYKRSFFKSSYIAVIKIKKKKNYNNYSLKSFLITFTEIEIGKEKVFNF